MRTFSAYIQQFVIVLFAATVQQTLAAKLPAPTSEAADVKERSEVLSPKCDNVETKMYTSNVVKTPVKAESTTTEIKQDPETIVAPLVAAASATPTKPIKQKKGKQNSALCYLLNAANKPLNDS